MKKNNDAAYLALILDPIKVCARYKPKFGQGNKGDGLTLEQFQTLYHGDSFYSWFGLDNPLMYAAHKAAGGMTSVYRQIGIGCEKLFRTVLRNSFALTDADVAWSYEVPLPGGKSRMLYLDGRATRARTPSGRTPTSQTLQRLTRVPTCRVRRFCPRRLMVTFCFATELRRGPS